MSRWKFMRQLEELLSDISPNEREEALQYYNDYFNDAGRENEQEVIKALGYTEQVAGIVRDGLSGNENLGEFTESGFKNSNIGQSNAIIKRTASGGSGSENGKDAGMRGTGAEKEGAQAGGSSDKDSSNEKPISGTGVTREKEGMPTWEIVLIVCACFLISGYFCTGSNCNSSDYECGHRIILRLSWICYCNGSFVYCSFCIGSCRLWDYNPAPGCRNWIDWGCLYLCGAWYFIFTGFSFPGWKMYSRYFSGNRLYI